MTDLDDKERAKTIKDSVDEFFAALQSREMPTPQEAGGTAARFAFQRALEREKSKAARKRPRKA